MKNREDMRFPKRMMWLTLFLVLAGLMAASGCAAERAVESAAVKAVVTAEKANVYDRPSTFSTAIAVVTKGQGLSVSGIKGLWAQVSYGAQKGYVLRRAIKRQDGASGDNVNVTTKQVQARLSALGYIRGSEIVDKGSAQSYKSVRIFQMMNGLAVTGKLNDPTLSKLMGAGARKMQPISVKPWKESGINGLYHTRGIAVIIDLATGLRMRIRRVGGSNHCDVEPATASDTEILRKMYGGTFSWDSRAVLFIAGGKCFAAAINGMPHGQEISTTNNYNGQFCLHLRGSLTHGTTKVNPEHQANITKAYNYLTT